MLYALNCVNYSLAAQIIFFSLNVNIGQGYPNFSCRGQTEEKNAVMGHTLSVII